MSYGRPDFPDLVTAVTRPAGGGTTRLTYDGNGNLTQVKDAAEKSIFITYDGTGYPLTVTDRNGNQTQYEYGYSPKALMQVKTPKEGGGFRTVTLEYDGFDNVTKAVDQLGQEVTMIYDGNDRLTHLEDARGNLTNFDIVNGLLEKITRSGLGATRETVLNYDSSGRLEEVLREIAPGSLQSRVAYSYDGFSQLRSLTRKKHSGASLPYTFTYDNLGRPISSNDTLNRETTVNYAPFCEIRSTTSARGIRTVSNFDLLCRLTQVSVGTPNTEDELELNVVQESRSFVYDPLGRMTSSTQAPSTLTPEGSRYGSAIYGQSLYSSGGTDIDGTTRTYTYNNLDRLTGVTFEDGKTASFEYDFEGNLTKMTDPEGKVTRYEYHPNNTLHKVKIERNEVVVGEFVYAYDSVGMPLTITYPSDTGITAHFTSSTGGRGWNENGQLQHLRYLKTGQPNPVRSFEFDYDLSGNRTLQIDTSPAGTVHWRYSYDRLDRLTKVEKGTSALDLLEVSHYSYDDSDNRTELVLPQDLVKYIYSYQDDDSVETLEKRDSLNSLLFTETFNFDTDGNLLTRHNDGSGVTTTYSWDGFDKLVAVSSADSGGPTNDAKQQNSYLANGFRRKKKAKDGTVTTEYATGLSTALAKKESETLTYIKGHQILGFEQGSNFYFFLHDQLGSVRDIVRGTDGAVLQSYDYTENGDKTIANPSAIQSDKTFVGGLSVNDDTGDSGLYLMGHRFYDPSLGRFLNRDPIGFAGGMNLYSYADASPATLTDHAGLQSGGDDDPYIDGARPIWGNGPSGLRLGDDVMEFAEYMLNWAGWFLPGRAGKAANIASQAKAASDGNGIPPLTPRGAPGSFRSSSQRRVFSEKDFPCNWGVEHFNAEMWMRKDGVAQMNAVMIVGTGKTPVRSMMGVFKKQARDWGAGSLEIHTQFENAKLKKTMSIFGEITDIPGTKRSILRMNL